MEADESNNSSAIPVEVFNGDVDLVVTETIAPSEITWGQDVFLSWTVTNNGNKKTARGFYDRGYLSDDEFLDDLDSELTSGGQYYTHGESILYPSDSYTVEQNVTIPQDAAGSTQYLLFITDDNQDRVESDETNNVRAVSIEFIAPNLTISNTFSPAEAVVNDTIDIFWTVTNTGNEPTSAYRWYD